jgi:PBSX family phage terminase large subunit
MSVPLTSLISPNFYELHLDIRDGRHDEYWLKGGRGSTKSTFASTEIVLGLIADPDANAIVFRRYSNELRDTVYGQFVWTITRMGLEDEFKFQYAPMQIILEETGQKIVFKGADNPKKIKSLNLGKGYVKYAWFEEVDQFAGMPEIRNIIQSLFRGEDHRRISIYSYNPPKSGRSWVNQEVKIRKPGRIVHHSTYHDVPREWVGERFIHEAEHLQQTNPVAYAHEYDGEEVGTGLEVFTNLEIREIDDDEIARFDRIRQGLDFGFAVDPAAFNRMHYDRTRARLYIFAEVSGIGLSNPDLWAHIKPYNDQETTADSAEPKSIDELRRLGMRIRGAKKGPDSVGFGMRKLQALNAIIIDPSRCPRAAHEFQNYAHERLRSGEVRSDYPDKNNHCFATGTLITTIRGDVPIEDINVGDLVLTRGGYKPVVKTHINGIKYTNKYTLSNGESFVATPNHRVFVANKGFIRLDAIRYYDTLWHRKGSYSKGTNIGDIQTLIPDQMQYISKHHDLPEQTTKLCIYTGKYGNQKTETSPQGATYTTKTETPVTTIYQIWSVLENLRIIGHTLSITTSKIKNGLLNTLKILGHSLRSGTHLKPVACGTANTQSGSQRSANPKNFIVNSAGKNTTQLNQRTTGFVQTPANQSGGETPELMMSQEHVSIVAKNSGQTNIGNSSTVDDRVHLVRTEPVGGQLVYDLTVADCHEYFANGILVHNCIDDVRYALEDDFSRDGGDETFTADDLTYRATTPQIPPFDLYRPDGPPRLDW